jgi:hypothetical protein
MALLLTFGCADTDQLEPDRSAVTGGTELRIVQPTPEQQERDARQFKRCLPAVADSAWPLRTDRKRRAQLRLPEHYRAESPDPDTPDGTAWAGNDSSGLMLEFNTGDDGQMSFMFPSGDLVEMVDDTCVRLRLPVAWYS